MCIRDSRKCGTQDLQSSSLREKMLAMSVRFGCEPHFFCQLDLPKDMQGSVFEPGPQPTSHNTPTQDIANTLPQTLRCTSCPKHGHILAQGGLAGKVNFFSKEVVRDPHRMRSKCTYFFTTCLTGPRKWLCQPPELCVHISSPA